MKLHLGPEVLTSEDIDDIISNFFTLVCAKCQRKWQAIDYTLYNKKKKEKKTARWLEDMNFIF